MPSSATMTNKAKACLAKAAPIPGSPLWNMGKVAVLGSRDSLQVLQNAVDYLTCKAQAKLAFSSDDKEFLVEIFEGFWWGGRLKGWPEAAQLANHYVHGKAAKLQIKADVYQSSVIVRDAMTAMKDFIRKRIVARKPFSSIRSDNAEFRASPQFRQISRLAGRSVAVQGYALVEGSLLAEQNNSRLKNTDNRFYLQAHSLLFSELNMHTRWRVDSHYDFESFERADYYTNIVLADGMILRVPDGLSHHMTVLGIAHDFPYGAEWNESWTL
jgi:hypothetical protein